MAMTPAASPHAITQTTRVSHRAARRLTLRRLVRCVGWGALAGGGAAVALAGLSRIVPARWVEWVPGLRAMDAVNLAGWARGQAVDASWGEIGMGLGVVAGGVVVIGVLAGAGWGLARRARALDGARALDERLALRNRLTSALELAHEPQGASPFAALALADAEAMASRVDPRTVTSVRWGWQAPAGLGLALIASMIWITTPRRAEVVQSPRQIATAEQTQALQTTVEQTREALSTLDEASAQRAQDALQELEKELSSGDGARSDSVTSAARAIDDAAGTLERRAEQARRDAQALDALADAAARARQQSDAASEPTGELLDSLAQGDTQAAAAAAEAMREQLANASPAERARAAEELRELARAMEQWEQETNQRDSAAQGDNAPEKPEEKTSETQPAPASQPPTPTASRESGEQPTERESQANELRKALEDAARQLDPTSANTPQADQPREPERNEPAQQAPGESSPNSGEPARPLRAIKPLRGSRPSNLASSPNRSRSPTSRASKASRSLRSRIRASPPAIQRVRTNLVSNPGVSKLRHSRSLRLANNNQSRAGPTPRSRSRRLSRVRTRAARSRSNRRRLARTRSLSQASSALHQTPRVRHSRILRNSKRRSNPLRPTRASVRPTGSHRSPRHQIRASRISRRQARSRRNASKVLSRRARSRRQHNNPASSPRRSHSLASLLSHNRNRNPNRNLRISRASRARAADRSSPTKIAPASSPRLRASHSSSPISLLATAKAVLVARHSRRHPIRTPVSARATNRACKGKALLRPRSPGIATPRARRRVRAM
jgi:hypothetical protein